MDDNKVQDLIRMATEIEALERSAFGEECAPIAKIGPGDALGLSAVSMSGPSLGRKLMAGAGMGLAAAACLAIAMVAMRVTPLKPPSPATEELARGGSESATPLDRGSSAAPAPVIVNASSSEPEACIVMTVFKDNLGECACLQVRQPKWEKLEEVPRSELYDLALGSPCSTDAQQALIIAVEGDPDSLPKDHAQVEAIAKQLSRAAASVGRHADMSALAYASLPGLKPGTTVIAESVPMRQASRMRELVPAGVEWR